MNIYKVTYCVYVLQSSMSNLIPYSRNWWIWC